MPRPAPSSNMKPLRALVVAVGLCWSVAFVVIALLYQLQLYADGSMFSYAVAVQDVWAFHWHNISGRLSVYFLSMLPAELYVGFSADPKAGIIVYGLLFYIAPLMGLIGTFVIDHSRNRVVFVYACFSTALLGPLVFGFPTEMWLAHALFWPALAASHYASRTSAGTALVFILLLALAFTHEGALVLTTAIVATLTPRGLRDALFLRAAAALILIVVLSVAVKIMIPPDEYYAGALMRAALHFFDPAIFKVSIVLLLCATLAGYGTIYLLLTRMSQNRAFLQAALVVLAALAANWLFFDHAIHASSRYYLRTAIVIVTPILGALAMLSAVPEYGQRTAPFAAVERALAALRSHGSRPLAAAFLLLTLVHVVETGKFVVSWRHYRSAIATFATGIASDPALGDSRFVSSDRIEGALNRLSWFSTTPYLSVIVADFSPNRLVVDPAGNYFWLSCSTATANSTASRAVPAKTRELVRVYSCLHR